MSASLSGMVAASFTGNNGTGGISIPGLEVGDLVIAIWQTNPAGSWTQPGNHFEGIVTVADELQQLVGSNYSSSTFTVLAFRGP